MSRFYDEFYKQKGTRHDDLVAKCVTDDETISKIISMDKPEPETHTLTIPSCDGVSYFPPGSPVHEWRSSPCREWDSNEKKYKMVGNRWCNNKICSFHPENENRCPWINDGVELKALKGEFFKSVGDVEFTYNTEVVCKNGSFIVGYADILFDLTWKLDPIFNMKIHTEKHPAIEDRFGPDDDHAKWFLKHSESAIVNRESYTYGGGYSTLADKMSASCHHERVSVLVEAKPELSDIGSVIRQLKTYRDLLMRAKHIQKIVVVTYTEVDKKYVSLLENEGITCITVSEDGRV